MHLVVVPPELPPRWLTALAGAEDVEVVVGLDAVPERRRDEVRGLLTLLTTRVDDALLRRFANLGVVSNMAVGYDNVDLDACRRRNLAVGNTPGVLTDATADLTFTLLLAAARNLQLACDDAREGRWRTWSPTGWLGVELRGATLGIVGLGKIGAAVAERARAFGMQLVYAARSPHQEAAALDAEHLPLAALLARSDFVSVHVPLTEQTHHLIDADALAAMKPTAILVNTSRGPVVDQDALLAALRDATIAGAALDVTDPEPLPPQHPLFAQPNCLIAPHIGSATETTRRRMAELACANLLAGVRGEPLLHAVLQPSQPEDTSARRTHRSE